MQNTVLPAVVRSALSIQRHSHDKQKDIVLIWSRSETRTRAHTRGRAHAIKKSPTLRRQGRRHNSNTNTFRVSVNRLYTRYDMGRAQQTADCSTRRKSLFSAAGARDTKRLFLGASPSLVSGGRILQRPRPTWQ